MSRSGAQRATSNVIARSDAPSTITEYDDFGYCVDTNIQLMKHKSVII